MEESVIDIMRRKAIERAKESGAVVYQTEGITLAVQFTYVLKDFKGLHKLLDLIRKAGFSASLTIDPEEIPESISITKNGHTAIIRRNEWFVSTGHVTSRCHGEILSDHDFKGRYLSI